MAKAYVKNSDLIVAILASKEKGQLTKETVEMFILMVQGISKKMAYYNKLGLVAALLALINFFIYNLIYFIKLSI